MKTMLGFPLAALLFASGAAAEVPSPEAQIAGALAAAPEDRRDEARVMGYSSEGELVVLREGSNDLICLADKPDDERFQTVCYHESLEPYMARGRALRAAGVEDTISARHEEADAGRLEMPAEPALLYNLGGPPEVFDAATGAVEGAKWLWVVYTPYATEASTGLAITPQAPGAPWLMRPGTASAHIMIAQP